MKQKHPTPVVKKEERTTSTRHAVETAIDLAKENRPWQSTKEIRPWPSSQDEGQSDKDKPKRLIPAGS
jgi:hypothetical protein